MNQKFIVKKENIESVCKIKEDGIYLVKGSTEFISSIKIDYLLNEGTEIIELTDKSKIESLNEDKIKEFTEENNRYMLQLHLLREEYQEFIQDVYAWVKIQ